MPAISRSRGDPGVLFSQPKLEASPFESLSRQPFGGFHRLFLDCLAQAEDSPTHRCPRLFILLQSINRNLDRLGVSPSGKRYGHQPPALFDDVADPHVVATQSDQSFLDDPLVLFKLFGFEHVPHPPE